jgi:hypothetical protein
VVDTIPLDAVAATDTVAGDSDNLWVHVSNASGGSINVTLTDAGKTPAGTASNPAGQVVAVGAGVQKLIKLPRALADPTTGLITVAFSSQATITARYYKF